MAVTNQQSTQCANIDAVPQVMNPASEIQGRIRFAQVDFTQVGDGEPTSTVDLCDVPSNAKILPQISELYQSGLGTGTTTLSVGYKAATLYGGSAIPAVANKFVDAQAAVSAGYVKFGTGAGAIKTPFTFLDLGGTDGKRQFGGGTMRLNATLGGTAGVAIADGSTIKGWVAYVTD